MECEQACQALGQVHILGQPKNPTKISESGLPLHFYLWCSRNLFLRTSGYFIYLYMGLTTHPLQWGLFQPTIPHPTVGKHPTIKPRKFDSKSWDSKVTYRDSKRCYGIPPTITNFRNTFAVKTSRVFLNNHLMLYLRYMKSKVSVQMDFVHSLKLTLHRFQIGLLGPKKEISSAPTVGICRGFTCCQFQKIIHRRKTHMTGWISPRI